METFERSSKFLQEADLVAFNYFDLELKRVRPAIFEQNFGYTFKATQREHRFYM